jgi:hypothetical protein
MATASKLVAYQYKPEDFEYVLLADLLAAQSSADKPRFTVEISVGAGKASVLQSDKKLIGVLHGDWIRWQCRLPFRLEFRPGHGPDGPGQATVFDSQPEKDLHSRVLNVGKLAAKRLDYDIFVEAEPKRWLKVDPSIIIETTLQRVFVPRLKDGIAFPPLRVVARRGKKAPARKAARKAATTASPPPKSKARRKK